MAIVLIDTPSFTAPVIYLQPVDGGKVKEHEFTVRFKALPSEELHALLARMGSRTAVSGDEQTLLTDANVAREVVVGFGDDVTEPDGTRAEFTTETLNRLLRNHGVGAAIVRSFLKHYVQAPVKN